MIIYYGTRHGGVVDRHGGEHAATRFVHVYWLPIIPIGSTWVTAEDGKHIRGVPIGLHPRSVLAAYARTWGVIAAIALIVSGSPGGIAAGAAIGAASLATWLWHGLRGERARRRSDLMEASVGVRCPPEIMSMTTARTLSRAVEQAWGQHSADRAPEDVARFGPASPGQAAHAFALLSLRARTAGGADGRRLREQAERIVDQAHEAPQLGAGPYRVSADAIEQDVA